MARQPNLETFFRSRLRRLMAIRADPAQALGQAGPQLVDRCIYSTILDLRELGVDVREATAAECRDG